MCYACKYAYECTCLFLFFIRPKISYFIYERMSKRSLQINAKCNLISHRVKSLENGEKITKIYDGEFCRKKFCIQVVISGVVFYLLVVTVFYLHLFGICNMKFNENRIPLNSEKLFFHILC